MGILFDALKTEAETRGAHVLVQTKMSDVEQSGYFRPITYRSGRVDPVICVRVVSRDVRIVNDVEDAITLAHEMGHHYKNHIVDQGGSTPPKEIEADYFSGYVMAKMGASLAEARAAMNKIAATTASSTHPAKADRLRAIGNGWNYAQGLNNTSPAGGPQLPQPQQYPQPQQQPQQNPTNSNTDPSWIQLALYGNSDMEVYLSDDGKKYAPAPLKVSEPFVFKFEVYNYGWLRFSNSGSTKTYRLNHGKDYAIVWSRRSNNWVVVEVP